MKALKGNILYVEPNGELIIHPNSFLHYDENGILGIFDNALNCEEIEDWGNRLILPSFADMHLHAPQYTMLGMGLDLPLLDWLKTYTFPAEARFKDPEFARPIYRKLALELIGNGTTKISMFSSLHLESTLVLMEEMEKAGLVGFVGKVNMDRNGSEELHESTEESIENTKKWILSCDKFKHIKPILTPRFTPSCTDELMGWLGEVARQTKLPIQSHLSENEAEVQTVKNLHPDCSQYWQTYQKYGLWNEKTLMAHCVQSSDDELLAIKKSGVTVVHCPSSNINLFSGFAQVRHMLDLGVKVVLGSDIAGGNHLCMFDNIASAIRVSKARTIIEGPKTQFLTTEEAFFLATGASSSFFGEELPFHQGAPLHAIVLDDALLPSTKELSLKERFQRAIYRRQKDAIVAVYGNNKRLK